MKRKIYDKLLSWKTESQGETALMIEGARRVGKSYIVEEFGKREYSSYILIDFNNTSQQIKDLFSTYLNDLDNFFLYLSLYTNVKLKLRNSLIIFDEVQRYPQARAALKYLVKDGRYDYIETGSLVSIKKNVKDITIPSEEESIQMHPMDFEEFLWAMGEDSLMDLIRTQFNHMQPMGQDMHRKAITWLRQYMIVGGMPQAVKKYADTRDFILADRQKRNILNLYRNDILQYADSQETKVTKIFDEIPSQLQRHERRFHLSDLKKDARYRDYDSAFFWLADAKVVNICYNSTQPNIGYRLTRDGNTLKCYMADTGLLITHSFDENTNTKAELYKKMMLGKLEVNEGMILENLVAQMLVTAGHRLYFFSSYSKTDASERMEIDFLVSKQTITNRHNVSAVEVKSGNNHTATSLLKFKNKYSSMLHRQYLLSLSDVRLSADNIYHLPAYMAPLL